jgi:hypothetical protein
VAGWLGFGAWLYSWSLFVEVRNEFSVADGSPPVWILVLLGLTTTALIAAAATAWMKFWFWPAIALVAGLSFAASVIGTQFVTMRIVTDAVTLSDAFNAALRERSAAGVVLVTAAPTLLVLAGAAGLVRRTRHQIRETVDV